MRLRALTALLLARIAFLINGNHPRDDFPTSAPSQGWPERVPDVTNLHDKGLRVFRELLPGVLADRGAASTSIALRYNQTIRGS